MFIATLLTVYCGWLGPTVTYVKHYITEVGEDRNDVVQLTEIPGDVAAADACQVIFLTFACTGFRPHLWQVWHPAGSHGQVWLYQKFWLDLADFSKMRTIYS